MVCDSQLWPPVATYNWVWKLAKTLSAIAVDTLFLDPWTCTSDQESSLERQPKELIRGKSQPLALSEYVSDLSRFGRVVQLTAFHPSESALNQINAVYLKQACSVLVLLDTKFTLLTACSVLIGSCIFEATKIPCQSNKFVHELLRGVRQHFDRFIKDLKPGELEKAQLGLAHSYSRAKVKFNVNRVVIQAIFLLDTLDKDINSFAMRVRNHHQILSY
ncbi:hypothetical protein F2Q70_00023536 [Brassica cretica]|uniref:Uncharacterized protein n=1 Tax=Brassica cretica TaxID=69181 RepID=A0A8S9GQQ2_BRACR|nr:hypothetical protein F2Q70_00023536 [Brassica cretica]